MIVSESYESVPYRGMCWHRYVSVSVSESESVNEYEYVRECPP